MKRKILSLIICILAAVCVFIPSVTAAIEPQYYAAAASMPFYGLKPEFLECRSQFYTSYSKSSESRKSNIVLAAKAINGTLIDVGGEFSFNRTVGERTTARGYKAAKIISGGKFVDGVGGGVCQVSTTLYNAALLGGLKITEYHAHSLSVSYVAASFDAMVNSGSADLKFVNNTDNPVLLFAKADGKKLTVSVYGEPMREKYERRSVIKSYIPVPQAEIVKASEGEYPDLYEGEQRVLSYGKQGLKSEGYIIKTVDGKPVASFKLRSDSYGALRPVIVEGCEKKQISELPDEGYNEPGETDSPTFFISDRYAAFRHQRKRA